MKKTRWRIKDLIDLEYFFQMDEADEGEAAQKAREERDRAIYLDHISPRLEGESSPSRRNLIKLWLEQRRDLEKKAAGPDAVLPGETFDDVYRLLIYAFTAFGILSGGGLAFSFLTYTGLAPLNVSVYLGGLVLLQIFLLVLLGGFFLVRMANRRFFPNSPLYTLVSTLVVRLTVKLRGQARQSLSGSQRNGLEAVAGLIRSKRRIYGSLFYWPVFILAQLFGVGFNLGVLGATLIRVMGSDMAFGWQSTVQLSPQAVYELVRWIALPWSWLVPTEIAHPSLIQIEGSRMILKDGIYHLMTRDLVSWWPFLCFSVLCYGLLPRAVLLISGLMVRNRDLGKLAFGHSTCDQLLRRLETPRLTTEGYPARAEPDAPPDTAADWPAEEPAAAGTVAVQDNGLIALIPDDIFEACPDEQLGAVVDRVLGYQVREKIRFGEDYSGDMAVLKRLAQTEWGEFLPNVMILQEAWQPPIKETMTFIQGLRKTLGDRSRIEVGLIGKPEAATIFTPVKEENWKIWKQKLSTMGDPYLRLERLVSDER